jgi:hypothetical protein
MKLSNEHGLKCPLPVEKWPGWATHGALDRDGAFYVYLYTPVLDYVNKSWRPNSTDSYEFIQEFEPPLDWTLALWARK